MPSKDKPEPAPLLPRNEAMLKRAAEALSRPYEKSPIVADDGPLFPICDNQAYTPGTECKCCRITSKILESSPAMKAEIDAFVSDNGEGDKVSILMPPDMRQWQFVSISPEDARVLAAKLVRAANAAESNRVDDEIIL